MRRWSCPLRAVQSSPVQEEPNNCQIGQLPTLKRGKGVKFLKVKEHIQEAAGGLSEEQMANVTISICDVINKMFGCIILEVLSELKKLTSA